MASNLETEFLTLCAWSNFAVAIVVSAFSTILTTPQNFRCKPDFDVATSRKHDT